MQIRLALLTNEGVAITGKDYAFVPDTDPDAMHLLPCRPRRTGDRVRSARG